MFIIQRLPKFICNKKIRNIIFITIYFIFSGQISPKSAQTKFDEVKKKIEDSGGKILKTESWGLRSLAYKIKKNSKGYYFLVNSECKPDVLNNFNNSVKLDEELR